MMGVNGARRILSLVMALLMALALFPSAASAAEEAPAEAPEIDETMLVETGEEELSQPAEDAAAEETADDPTTQEAEEEEPDPAPEPVPYDFPTDANGNRYYIDPSTGERHTGWLYLNGLWYYFWSNGNLVTGWCKASDGYWYYFEKDTGVVHRGWATCQGYTYYMRPEDGTEQKGWRKIDGNWYYFWSNGRMATGWCRASDGYWYYFDKDTGAVHYGWATCQGYTYYMRPEDGTKQTGWRKIDDNYYYFGSDGKMRTGWQLLGGEYYYFYKENDPNGGPAGANAHDVTIDGREVLSNGAIENGHQVYLGEIARWYTSKTPYLILVDTTYCKVGVFQGSWNNWDLIKYWDCAPGKPSTPTVKGVFSTSSQGYYFDSGIYRCYYYTEFYGPYLFHSVLYDQSTYKTASHLLDGRTGLQLSHGCVRLDIDNAYWIYWNIPRGTTVYVF